MALKFGRGDGTGMVELAGWFEGTTALIAVRDDGAGIEAADRSRIFERFYRMADHARVTGTGLGLPIARELAEAMGRALDVASLPGTGSTFVLALAAPGGTLQGAPAATQAVLERVLAEETSRLATTAALRRGRDADRAPAPAGGRRSVLPLRVRAAVGARP